MLGTRGVRLGILVPAIYEMQVEAICRACGCGPRARRGHARRDHDPAGQLPPRARAHARADRADGDAHGLKRGADYSIGTMIELPRACLRADEIAHEADFFSFGTNDLTQTALGFSRDDIEARILARYIETKVFDRSPFETLDTPGVGQLVRMGAWLGRKTRERPDSSASAANTAATPTRSISSTTRASTTSPARPTAYPWRASRPRRPPYATWTAISSTADWSRQPVP